ncbi:multicopper oxidase-domain-containing protein [Obelidium mucronatum]|nr:multicopper oxidase-domain-containing protein [Obelidium mucronatum]
MILAAAFRLILLFSSFGIIQSRPIRTDGPLARSKPQVKEITMNLSHRIFTPDGGVPKLMMVANDVLDYEIHVWKGDRVVITVNNNSNLSTSIHWHGLFQVDTPWMDGAAMVTQCLIESGRSMIYNFTVGNQAGTYWWHAHYGAQYTDGLRGPFIIHDPDDAYRDWYDEEIVMTLSDHFHKSGKKVLETYYNAFDPVPDSFLMNSIGQYKCSFAAEQCVSNQDAYKVFNVVAGKRYRIRIINTSAQAQFELSLDGHNMTVIEADGVYTNPTVVNSIPISASQRYSVIVNATSDIQSYWFRAGGDGYVYTNWKYS